MMARQPQQRAQERAQQELTGSAGFCLLSVSLSRMTSPQTQLFQRRPDCSVTFGRDEAAFKPG